jgi:hypothetical protein
MPPACSISLPVKAGPDANFFLDFASDGGRLLGMVDAPSSHCRAGLQRRLEFDPSADPHHPNVVVVGPSADRGDRLMDRSRGSAEIEPVVRKVEPPMNGAPARPEGK